MGWPVTTLVTLLLAQLLQGDAAPGSQVPDAGGLVFEPAVLDLGNVPAGGSRSGTVRIRNASPKDRVITVAASSCACTKVQWPSGPIAPGGTAEAVITMSPPGAQGAVEQRTVTFVIDGDWRAVVTVRASVGSQGPAAAPPGADTPAGAAASAPPIAGPGAPRFVRVEPPVFPGARVPFPRLGAWVKGRQHAAYEPGMVYVFEFFETSCGHCKEYAGLVKQLASEFGARGFEFVAVTSEHPDAVQEWLSAPGKGAGVPYSVALDPDRSALALLQGGTFRSFNPRFFVIRDGVVLWHGHPKAARAPLQAIADGTWDPAKVRDEFVTESVVARAKNHLDAVARQSDSAGDWAPMFRALDEVRAAVPERAAQYDTQRFVIMIGLAGMPDEGYAFGRRVAAENPGDMVTQRSLARGALQSPFVKRRDLDFGMECALAADRLAGGMDARAADTVALAWFSKGDRARAIANAERAVQLEKDPKARRQYEHALARFRTAAPGPEPTRERTKPTPGRAAPTPGDAGDSSASEGP
jgi:thiol-disulfide isomerase/thioredoxin